MEYTEKDLVKIAKRENNTKRNYLVVDPLQGKHIPVVPSKALDLFAALADTFREKYKDEKLLLVGFAETATAIGAQAAITVGADYIQTTREVIPGVNYLFFSEEHSHATEQKLVKDDIDRAAAETDRIIFIEDEVTTGKTIRNIISILDREYDALDGIVDDDYVSPRLPNIISPRHKDVEEKIKKELKFKQYVANEAEQRKNDLVVYLAHDLKTPLTSIIGYLSLLDENPDFSVEYRAKYTGIALDKAYRLEQLINEFFDITRFNLQSFPLENNHIDLSLLLRQMAEEFYPVLKEKNLTCTVKAEDKVNIIGDSDKLSRVFDNLMRNASNYCYEGTNIEINVFKNGENAVVTFINQGDKIEKEKLDMIFEKFFRADTSRTSKTGGTGLGLAIAKQIVERHGGTITAKSNEKYTIFTVSLPLNN